MYIWRSWDLDAIVLYPPPHIIEKKYDLGVVCHQSHGELSIQRNSRIKIISINRTSDEEIEAFVNEVSSCHSILSSSLHGLIIAQSYGIPARHFFVNDTPIHPSENFKFEDYMLGIGQEIIEPLLLDKEDLLNILAFTGKIPEHVPDLKEQAEALLKAFPASLL